MWHVDTLGKPRCYSSDAARALEQTRCRLQFEPQRRPNTAVPKPIEQHLISHDKRCSAQRCTQRYAQRCAQLEALRLMHHPTLRSVQGTALRAAQQPAPRAEPSVVARTSSTYPCERNCSEKASRLRQSAQARFGRGIWCHVCRATSVSQRSQLSSREETRKCRGRSLLGLCRPSLRGTHRLAVWTCLCRAGC